MLSIFKSSQYSRILFYIGIFIGTFISISSSSWLLVWMGLEVNIMCFIGWMCGVYVSGHSTPVFWGVKDYKLFYAPNVEPFAKYFMVQSVGRIFFLLCPVI